MEGYTPEDLAAAGLSPEEIAAMTDDACIILTTFPA